MCGSRDLAEDLVQQTYVKVLPGPACCVVTTISAI